MSDFTVSGSAGSAVTGTDAVITLTDEGFTARNAGDDVGSRITNLPGGLRAAVKTGVPEGAAALTLTIS
ncbi:MAG: hypothetical protein LBP32_04995, partial [Spirochaetaceae bacterium]|nr:hypothetical protein [Spirochaetaceae bacterium]